MGARSKIMAVWCLSTRRIKNTQHSDVLSNLSRFPDLAQLSLAYSPFCYTYAKDALNSSKSAEKNEAYNQGNLNTIAAAYGLSLLRFVGAPAAGFITDNENIILDLIREAAPSTDGDA